MKKTKKILGLLICIAMVMSLMPTTFVSASTSYSVNGDLPTSGTLEQGVYKLTANKTYSGDRKSTRLAVASGATVIIDLNGYNLTATGGYAGDGGWGGDASTASDWDNHPGAGGTGGAGGKAGIYVPTGATLIIVGNGKLTATGGNGGNFGHGGDGANYYHSKDNIAAGGSGGGGAGGGGGGGAGGHGVKGGDGGAGGIGRWKMDKDSTARFDGGNGGDGYNAGSTDEAYCGTIMIADTVTKSATYGSNGNYQSYSPSRGDSITYTTFGSWHVMGGGGAGGNSHAGLGGQGIGYGGDASAGGGGGGGGGLGKAGIANDRAYGGDGSIAGGTSINYGSSKSTFSSGNGGRGGVHSSLSSSYTYQALSANTITFDKQGGSGGTDSVSATPYTTLSSVSIPARAGYTFGGYYTEANGGGTQIYNATGNFSGAYCDYSNYTTLFAKWIADSYTVTFAANGHGSAPEEISADYGTTITEPTAPTEAGYTFGGWYKESDCTTPWDFENDTVTEATTLFAKWVVETEFETTTDSGYYAEEYDGANKSGVIAFNSVISNFASLPQENITKFGFALYLDGAVSQPKFYCDDIDGLKTNGGAFYALVKNIAESEFSETVYAKPFITIDEQTYWGDIETSIVNAAKWLGAMISE